MPFGKHFENRVVSLAREIAVRIGARDQGKEFVFVPPPHLRESVWRGRPARVSSAAISCRRVVGQSSASNLSPDRFRRSRASARATRAALGRARRHNLLRQNVQRRVGNDQAVEIALPDGAHQRCAFQQFVARGGEESSFGNRAAPVAGTSDALQRNRDRPRRTDLHHQVDGADIDSQFQRGGRHQHFDLAFFQLLSPRPGAACATGCRDARQRCLRPGARPDDAPRVPPAAAC